MDNQKNISNLNKSKIIESQDQLTDIKKIHNGFKKTDSVIDIGQNNYGISYNDDILFTYGIGPCLGLILIDDNKKYYST